MLALLLALLAGVAPFTSTSGFPSASAAICGLATLLALLVSSTLIGLEKARRRRSESRLARLLQGTDQSDALVTIVNRKGRIEYVNRSVELATGYPDREVLSTAETRWFPWYADPRVAAEVRRTLLSGQSFQGAISCRRKNGTPFLIQETVTPLREGEASPARFVSTARDITQQRSNEERVAFLSSFDPLTGLPNRSHFAQLLNEALARQAPAANPLVVLVLDIDRFKDTNDLLAPGVGDAVLRRVAEVLRPLAGSRGIVGRLGSDEFAVVQPLQALGEESGVAHSIRAALAHHAGGKAEDLPITATFGIACCPRDGRDGATLLRNADLALAHAKTLGRDSIRTFSPELSAQAQERYSLQRRLAGALRNGDYQVFYQPYCELTTGRVSGAEALIRWRDADQGVVSPAKFIPVLEDSGLIVAVGEWVLRTACRQIKDWQRTRFAFPVAVNLSQLQLGQHDLLGMVSGAVKEHAIDPRQLTLELTESSCVQDLDLAIGLLRRLKEIGVAISVDDFGTGYSSLSHVKRLPVDNLKIDMSFVSDVTRDPDAASIITAITSMARSLGLKTIAEGVETAEQANVLRLLRCDLGQGYHFGRAVAPGTFEQLIAE